MMMLLLDIRLQLDNMAKHWNPHDFKQCVLQENIINNMDMCRILNVY